MMFIVILLFGLHKSIHVHVDAADTHLALDRPDRFKRYAHGNQDGAGGKGHLHTGQPQEQRRHSGQDGQEQSRKQVQTVYDVLQILPDILAPLSGDHGTLLLQ